MKKITIHTQQTEHGTWSCSTQIKGEDISFEQPTMSMAQFVMTRYLGEIKFPREHRKWEAPVMYQSETN